MTMTHAQTMAAPTSGRYPTCNWTSRVPVTTTPRNCHRDPIANDHAWSKNSMKNGNAMFGFHGWMNCEPKVNDEYANASAVRTPTQSKSPPRRNPSHAAAAIAKPWSNALETMMDQVAPPVAADNGASNQ